MLLLQSIRIPALTVSVAITEMYRDLRVGKFTEQFLLSQSSAPQSRSSHTITRVLSSVSTLGKDKHPQSLSSPKPKLEFIFKVALKENEFVWFENSCQQKFG